MWAFACSVFALRFASLRVHALVGRGGGRGNLLLLVNSSQSLWVLEGDSHYDNQLSPNIDAYGFHQTRIGMMSI